VFSIFSGDSLKAVPKIFLLWCRNILHCFIASQ